MIRVKILLIYNVTCGHDVRQGLGLYCPEEDWEIRVETLLVYYGIWCHEVG